MMTLLLCHLGLCIIQLIAISDWAAVYVDEMSAIGAFIGDDRNSFNPQNNITKEEFVVILLRLADKFI